MTRNSLRKALGMAALSICLIILFRGMIHFDAPLVRYVLVGAIICYGLFFFALSIFTSRIQFLNPLVLMPFTYMMYALGPISQKGVFSTEVINMYLWYMFIGIAALLVGLSVLDKEAPEKTDTKPDNDFAYQMTFLSLFALALISSYSEISAFGGLGALLNVGYGTERFEVFSKTAVFGGSFQWLLLASMILFVYSWNKRQLFGLIVGGGVGLLTIYILLLIGGRSTIIYAALFLMVLVMGTKKFRSSWLISLFMFLGIVFAQMFSYARAFLSDGVIVAVKEVWKIVVRNTELFMPLPGNINEFVIPATSLLDTLKFMPNARLFGATYLTVVNSLVPGISRFIGDFGFNPSNWYLRRLYPVLYWSNAGRGFSPVTEGYLNFGIVGIVIQLFLYGLFAQWLYQKMMQHDNYLTRLLYAGAFPILTLDGMRIFLSSALYKLSRIYLLPFLLFVVFHYLTHRRHVGRIQTVAAINPEEPL